MININAGRSAVRRAFWFASVVCILATLMLVTGIAAYFGFKPAAALWVWIGLQPTPPNLGSVLAMLVVAGSLLVAFRWALRLTVVGD